MEKVKFMTKEEFIKKAHEEGFSEKEIIEELIEADKWEKSNDVPYCYNTFFELDRPYMGY